MTRRVWRIEVPVATALNLNETLHKRVKSARIQQIRQAARGAALRQHIPRLGTVTAELHFIPTTRQRRDPENWTPTSKAIVDGLILAGVADDDSPAYFTPRTPVMDPPQRHVEGSRYYVIVTDGTLHTCTVPGCPHTEEIIA